MFSPTGPSITLSTNGTTSGSLSFSSINRDNPVLRVAVNNIGNVLLTFSNNVEIGAYAGENFFHIPHDVTSVSLYISGGTAPSGTASVSVGENI